MPYSRYSACRAKLKTSIRVYGGICKNIMGDENTGLLVPTLDITGACLVRGACRPSDEDEVFLNLKADDVVLFPF